MSHLLEQPSFMQGASMAQSGLDGGSGGGLNIFQMKSYDRSEYENPKESMLSIVPENHNDPRMSRIQSMEKQHTLTFQ